VYPVVARGLKGRVRPADRLLIEKPFGDSARSAGKLEHIIGEVAPASQVALVDHYLAKDAVLMLGKLRHDRRLGPVLDREHVRSITIRALESAGVSGRGGFYDRVGAVRDMVQGHLLQVLSTTIMEPPKDLTAGALGSAKARVLRKARVRRLVRGQYGAGRLNGKPVPGYRSEPGVRPDSNTETYAALALDVDSPRWRGVPIILEAGKALPDNVKEVEIRFRKLPRELLRSIGCRLPTRSAAPAGRLTINLASARMSLRVGRRVIGLKTDLGAEPRMQAYARLLDHALRNDDSPTVFARMDETVAAWNLLDPVLGEQAPRIYRAGSRSALRAARRRLRPRRWLPRFTPSRLLRGARKGDRAAAAVCSGRRVQTR
jgi:glucose-6-phosphate 1-dehydrogenase